MRLHYLIFLKVSIKELCILLFNMMILLLLLLAKVQQETIQGLKSLMTPSDGSKRFFHSREEHSKKISSQAYNEIYRMRFTKNPELINFAEHFAESPYATEVLLKTLKAQIRFNFRNPNSRQVLKTMLDRLEGQVVANSIEQNDSNKDFQTKLKEHGYKAAIKKYPQYENHAKEIIQSATISRNKLGRVAKIGGEIIIGCLFSLGSIPLGPLYLIRELMKTPNLRDLANLAGVMYKSPSFMESLKVFARKFKISVNLNDIKRSIADRNERYQKNRNGATAGTSSTSERRSETLQGNGADSNAQSTEHQRDTNRELQSLRVSGNGATTTDGQPESPNAERRGGWSDVGSPETRNTRFQDMLNRISVLEIPKFAGVGSKIADSLSILKGSTSYSPVLDVPSLRTTASGEIGGLNSEGLRAQPRTALVK
eukprot:NODE_375_length_8520_cov_0.377390.p1 type:complete len:426 gc:universal NODE_375_length_8520_cov_0.377390:4165-5442(+)